MRTPFLLWILLFSSCFCSMSAAETGDLKVLTFNTWLLDVPVLLGFRTEIAEDMEERMRRMPQALAETGADIVVLQEVWSPESKARIAREMKSFGYDFSASTLIHQGFKFFDYEMGDGLLVLSKLPISPKALSFDFKVSTQDVERFARKGAIKLTILHPTMGWIDVYASHVGAIQFEKGQYNEAHLQTHREQIRELAEWIRTTRSHSTTVLAADLNMHYQKWQGDHFIPEFSEDYELLKNASCGEDGSFLDSYLNANHKTVLDRPAFTFSQSNPYVSRGYFDSLPSEVEDYIFVCDNQKVESVESSLVFENARLSDHFGVMTTFRDRTENQQNLVKIVDL